MIVKTKKIQSMTEFEILLFLSPIEYETIRKNYSSDSNFVNCYLNEVNTREHYCLGPDEYVRRKFP
jgi:hypothetical protein